MMTRTYLRNLIFTAGREQLTFLFSRKRRKKESFFHKEADYKTKETTGLIISWTKKVAAKTEMIRRGKTHLRRILKKTLIYILINFKNYLQGVDQRKEKK
jgi:hypothetical protein